MDHMVPCSKTNNSTAAFVLDNSPQCQLSAIQAVRCVVQVYCVSIQADLFKSASQSVLALEALFALRAKSAPAQNRCLVLPLLCLSAPLYSLGKPQGCN